MSILSLTKKKPRETRLWQFDPSLFQPLPKASPLERYFLGPARSLGKHTLYASFLAYPVVLVCLGIIFGGLVFWASFVGSIGLIWLVIKKTGYARNFASWDIGYKHFIGLVGGFGLALGFLLTLFYLKAWTFPIVAGILVMVLIVGVRRISNR